MRTHLDARHGAAALMVVALLAVPAAAPASQKTPSTTKLLRGPIAFRLTGWQHADPTTSLGDYRYAIAFKLNRDPQGRLPDTAEEQNRGVSRGIFALDGWDTEVGHLYPPKHSPAGKANCFLGYVAGAADTDPPGCARRTASRSARVCE
ncbi:hypothetical protein [Baekduia sp. Peel2402]|uniref:hypothetical protein n=1 Tax=Baekduia sp. Peel2402 TaxID=3458296 RepID=UPI00403E6145